MSRLAPCPKLRGTFFALMVVTACAGDAPTLGDAPPGAPLALEPGPQVSVGVLQGDSAQQFGRVGIPFLMPDGRLVVPDLLQRKIRVFGPDGVIQWSFGGVGGGPGEITQFAGAWARGDSIEIYDSRLRRVTRIGPDGGFIMHSLTSEHDKISAIIPGTFGDGWVGYVLRAQVPGQDTLHLTLVAADGASAGEVARVPGMVRVQHPGVSGPAPLSPRNVHVVRNDRLYFGETLTPIIRVVNVDGEVVQEIPIAPAETLSPADAWRRAQQAYLSRSSADDLVDLMPHFTAGRPPERVPTYADFIVDELGFIWVLPYDPDFHSFTPSPRNMGARWRIFSPEGAEVGTVAIPPDLVPTYITREAVVGIRRDEFDMETVQIYALSRR